jgi:hypothetical protein
MKDYFEKLFYSDKAWFCLKLFLAFFWLNEMNYMIWETNKVLIPVGVCTIFDCSCISNQGFKVALSLSLLVGLFFYLKSEKYNGITLPLLFLFSVFIISSNESTGVFMRASLFSMVWFGQWLAHLIHKKNPDKLRKYRHQYVVQLITATYCLAGVSKILDAGWNWPEQGSELLALSSIKGFYFDFFDTGNHTNLNLGYSIAYTILNHKTLVCLFLWATLILELSTPLANLSLRLTFFYGILLFLMHRGIDYSMNIVIGGTYYSMLAFMVNPIGIIYLLYLKYFKGTIHNV